jgi:hypothetical protein
LVGTDTDETTGLLEVNFEQHQLWHCSLKAFAPAYAGAGQLANDFVGRLPRGQRF